MKKHLFLLVLCTLALLIASCSKQHEDIYDKCEAEHKDKNEQPPDPNENEKTDEIGIDFNAYPELLPVIQLLLNDDVWYNNLEWHIYYDNFRFVYGQDDFLRATRHELAIWQLFKDDPAIFWRAVSVISRNSVIDDTIFHNWDHVLFPIVGQLPLHMVNARIVDPILYAEMTASLAYVQNHETCERILGIIALLPIIIQSNYDATRAWRKEYLQRWYSWDDRPEPVQQDDIDWTQAQLPGPAGTYAIGRAYILFNHGGEELGALYIMYDMLFGVHGWNITELSFLLAYLNDGMHDPIISAIVNRLIALRNQGYELYRVFLDLLINERVFDPRTQAISEKIHATIHQYMELCN